MVEPLLIGRSAEAAIQRRGGSLAPRVPLIGITAYAADADERYILPRQYVDAIRRAGGAALIIPPGPAGIETVMNRIDGLLLAGGGDIDPKHYQGADHPKVYGVSDERDEGELELARRAIDARYRRVDLDGWLEENLVETGALTR